MNPAYSTPTRQIARTLVVAALATAASMAATIVGIAPAKAQSSPQLCGPLANHYGPFDYRTERGRLRIVEEFHFTPGVEGLVRGRSGSLGGDLNYTLRTSPNHHRALLATMRFSERLKKLQPPDMEFTVECYLERAVRFKPDDTVSRALFAQYLGKLGRTKEAVAQLDVSVGFAKDNPLSHYNLGLLYAELGEFDKALVQAHTAIKMGLDRPDLKEMLVKAGKWQEPTP
jgi:tetratricopeptide (TPR) repeat protein